MLEKAIRVKCFFTELEGLHPQPPSPIYLYLCLYMYTYCREGI